MEKSAGSLMVMIATQLPSLLAVPAVAGAEEMASVPVESAARSGGGVAPVPPTAPEARHPASLRLRLLHPRHPPLRLLAAPAVAGAEAMASVPVESAARSGGGVAPAPGTAPEARHPASLRLLHPRLRLLAVPAVAGAEEMASVPAESAARSGGGVAPVPPTAVDDDRKLNSHYVLV
jgi:hypothetical protein